MFLACGFVIMIACRQTSEFVVKGVVAEADGLTIYLENIGLSSIELIDSVKLNSSGKFAFKKPRPAYPDFYRLRLNNQLINFAIDSLETISVIAEASSFATSYSVEGSISCVEIKEISLAQLDVNKEIKKLRTDFEAGHISDSIFNQASLDAINNYKKNALKYIYDQPMSKTSYFALFQTVDRQLLFDLYDKIDLRAYSAVATSLNHLYPESPRAKHLYNLTLQALRVMRNEDLVNLEAREINLLDMELPNISGEKIKLSEIAKGKVVMLNFTAYQADFSPELNQRLENIYSRHHLKGLEIYQVSLDSDIHFWKNVVSNFPWICVNDPQSLYSQFAAIYNVSQLPAIFLIDKNGVVVKRIEDINTIENDVLALL